MEFVYTVVGIRQSSFPDKKTNEIVSYGRVYVTYDEDNDTTGTAADAWKISPDKIKASGVQLGDTVEPLYNKYGKVANLTVINEEG